jgi:hypothetical protein
MKYFMALLLLTACAPSAPNHMGNPLLLPVGALTTGVGNGFYNHRRSKVSRFVSQNFVQLKKEALAGGGPTLSQAMSIARVTPVRQPELIADLKANPKLYFSTDQEQLVIALMVYGP